MPAPPARTELADAYPLPSNATLRGGLGKLWDYATGLLGSSGNASDARTALGVIAIPPGIVWSYDGATLPDGFIWAAGKTIGNAASAATERANADTAALFALYWNSMADAEAPVSGGRGASAAADFAANKTITVPDRRGRSDAGKDDMGGTAANRLTAAGSGITGTTLGTSGGGETHTLTTAEMPSHVHAGGVNSLYTVNGGASINVFQGVANTSSAGGGGAHNNVPPTYVTNKIIKL
ncbi:hypothetical protein [Polaromonas sp.]|uniref:hypothetical protein n=1 Tax=Polaromonas sp. TaxID=1869339 RepID=UPI00272F766B|nr:hypothetical protein [Polaromonas sp.]MDP1886636.1 hypothetical protein [Polaromonas sp.]